jgi:competence protein ComEC
MTLVIATVAWAGARLRLRHHPVWLPLTLVALAGYTLLVGADAAVVRAALMGGLTVVALAVGRRADPLVALVVAACVMTGLQPGLLVDLGFQLSFLATLGLLVVLPPLAPRLAAWPWPLRGVAEPLVATVAAQLAVEPLLAYTFGQVSLIAPVVNLLAAPWVPLVMVGALAVVGLGLLGVPLLTEVAALMTTLAATPLLAVVEWGARLPFASASVPPPPAPAVVAIYALLAAVAALLLTPDPAVRVRRALVVAGRSLPALGLAGLATAAGVVWLLLLRA